MRENLVTVPPEAGAGPGKTTHQTSKDSRGVEGLPEATRKVVKDELQGWGKQLPTLTSRLCLDFQGYCMQASRFERTGLLYSIFHQDQNSRVSKVLKPVNITFNSNTAIRLMRYDLKVPLHKIRDAKRVPGASVTST